MKLSRYWGMGIISRKSAGIGWLPRGSSEIGVPRSPIVFGPSFGDAGEVAIGDIDVGEFDSAAALVGPK